MEPWEDELLWDDDFSDEGEDTEEQIEETDLEMDADGFADWEDASDGAPENESLEEALAEERTLELESELEQDEHPRDYNAELEDEEEEAAPTSEKRLKREIRAEAVRRLEEAARTESDFLTVVDEWNKLDRNRERRERDHENLRGDVPLEFQAVPEPRIAPLWMNLPRFRQLCQGNFLDIIFSCPYELHELTANRFLSKLFFTLSDEQKEVLYYLFVKQYSTTRLAAIRGQSDRNIRKLRMTIQKKLQKQMYEHLSEKLEKDYSITLREREFVEEYEALLQTMGKDAVIRRENKTKPRKNHNHRPCRWFAQAPLGPITSRTYRFIESSFYCMMRPTAIEMAAWRILLFVSPWLSVFLNHTLSPAFQTCSSLRSDIFSGHS
mgnify:FL=1